MSDNVYETSNPMMFNKLKDIIQNHLVSYFNILKSKDNKDIMQWIDSCVLPKLSNYKISTKCNWILNGIEDFPHCENCARRFGMNINVNVNGHYSKTCPACARKVAAKTTKTVVAQKLDADPHYYDAIISKRKTTNMQRHNDPNWNNAFKNKATCQERYGVDNVRKTAACKMKIKQTKKFKHGDENWNNVQKFKNTCMQNHGVEWPMQCAEVRSKAAAKYSYDNMEFDSKHELCFYVWLKENNLKFEYKPSCSFSYVYCNVIHYYHPDFIVDEHIIEIKGDHFFKEDGTMCNPYDHSQDGLYEVKHQCMLANNVKIILQSECDEYVKFVNDKHGKDFIQSCKRLTSK